jgi:hypothetical protein
MAKAKTDARAKKSGVRAPKSPGQRATVTGNDVARRAYDLYLGRGCDHGHDMDDWLQAERELQGDPES